MRSRDKRKNIDRANYLAEQRYLKSKGLVTETSARGHNGMEPFMEINKDGTFTEGFDEPKQKSEIDPTYTHFAVDKATGEIVNGWEFTDSDPESIRYYAKIDLGDMYPERKTSEFKVLTKKGFTKLGIDPFDSDNWYKTQY